MVLDNYLRELQVGKHNQASDSKYDPKELAMGIKIEKEHTDDIQTAENIAKDHLDEIGDYYSRLKKMEAEGKVRSAKKKMTQK